MLTLADTHCHLDFQAFDPDRQQVLERAWQAGVERILVPGIDIASSRAAVSLANRDEHVYAAIGVHPNSANTWSDDSLAELRTLAQNPKVVAIGEIGLDYYRNQAPRSIQVQVFQEQLTLAAELDLPIVVHNRQATQDILKTLMDWYTTLQESGSPLAQRPGVLHSYSGDLDPALQATDRHFFIGLTGPLTFHNAKPLQHVASSIPLDRVLIETDAPFLAPHPHRGRRNEPAFVRLVVEKLAELHDLPVEKVARTTLANAARLFLWGVPS